MIFRVTFHARPPHVGAPQVVDVEVPHWSRAPAVAYDKLNLRTDEWYIYSEVEVPAPVDGECHTALRERDMDSGDQG